MPDIKTALERGGAIVSGKKSSGNRKVKRIESELCSVSAIPAITGSLIGQFHVWFHYISSFHCVSVLISESCDVEMSAREKWAHFRTTTSKIRDHASCERLSICYPSGTLEKTKKKIEIRFIIPVFCINFNYCWLIRGDAFECLWMFFFVCVCV